MTDTSEDGRPDGALAPVSPAVERTPLTVLLGRPPTPAAAPATPAPPVKLRPRRATKPTVSPAVGLPLAVVLGLVGAFFAWVSVDPLLLAAGRGATGTVTVAECHRQGLATACVGRFASPRFAAERVRVLGADASVGATVPARMLTPRRSWAYAGSPAGLHLRWLLGVALMLLAGAGLATVTGVRRLAFERRSSRLLLRLGLLLAPLGLFVGMLAAAWL